MHETHWSFSRIVFLEGEKDTSGRKPWEQSEHTQEMASISEQLKFKEKKVQT